MGFLRGHAAFLKPRRDLKCSFAVDFVLLEFVIGFVGVLKSLSSDTDEKQVNAIIGNLESNNFEGSRHATKIWRLTGAQESYCHVLRILEAC